MIDDIIVGLDIGSTKVCAVVGVINNFGELEIVGVGIGKTSSRGLRKGAVINIDAIKDGIIRAIEDAELMSGYQVSSVIIGISAAHVEGINSRGVTAVKGRDNEISAEDVERVIDAAKTIVLPMDREILHVIPQEYIVDGEKIDGAPEKVMGTRFEVKIHVITSSVTISQNLIKSVNRAGLRASGIVLDVIASAYSVLMKEDKDKGVLVIDMGGGTTDLLLYMNGSPYQTDVVALGGEQVTTDIHLVLGITMEAAEKIKVKSGCCYRALVDEKETVLISGQGLSSPIEISKLELTNIIQPRMKEIFMLVKKRIKYLDLIHGGIVLTGGGAMMPGVSELANSVFGLPCRIGYPLEPNKMDNQFKTPMFSTVLGLLLYAKETIKTENEGWLYAKRSEKNILKKILSWFKEFV